MGTLSRGAEERRGGTSMKRLVTALLAAGMTVSSMSAVLAEPAHKETGTGTAADRQLTADFRRSPGDAVKDLYRQAAPFLTKEIILRNHAVYTPFVMTPSAKKMAGKEIPFSTEKGGVFPAGQLLVASDEGSFDAFVMNFSFPETEENKKGMDPFFAKDQNMVSAGALMMANLYLMGAEPAINELIVDAIHEHNKTALVKLPEDFAHVRLQDIEPITRLNDHTYTAGARVISDADGFIVPLYIRGYFMKKENRYRAILAVTSDAERNYLKPSLEELAKTSMKY